MPQLSTKEQSAIEKVLHAGGTATDAWKATNAAREKKDVPPIGCDAVHRFVKGKTHPRDHVEKRGRKEILSKADLRKLDQTRIRLLKKSNNETRVTYKDVAESSGLDQKVSGAREIRSSLPPRFLLGLLP